MRTCPTPAAAIALAVLVLNLSAPALAAPSWLPVPPEDLEMTSEPRAPGASAIVLYHEFVRNDAACFEQSYDRIKILTEEGRKQANVELGFDGTREWIRAIQARTIHSDGKIVPFDGTIYDTTLMQGQGAKLLAKSFTLPAVEVGSIIEYRYEKGHSCLWVSDSRWILNGDLFIRDAHYALTPGRGYTLRWTWPGQLPEGTQPPKLDQGLVKMEAHNLPAFVTEPYMPPVNELRQRVDFIYSADSTADPVQFWKHYGQTLYHGFAAFVDARRAMKDALAQIVQPQDPPQTQLRKIYARVQQLRNVDLETLAEREAQGESTQQLRDAADVLKRGYGNTLQLSFTLVALARAAGITADPVIASTRDRYFFHPNTMNTQELNALLVLAHVDGKDLFLQAALPFLPFGILPWNETWVQGLKLDEKGGTWVTTPLPPPEDSRVERKASLNIGAGGLLTGKVTVTYSGQAAGQRRFDMKNSGEEERLDFLRGEIGGPGPQAMLIKVVNTPDWTTTEAPLVIEYEVSIPDWVQQTGHRQLFPAGLFGRQEQHLFEHDTRVHPLYFTVPSVTRDDLTLEVPAGWSVASLPQGRNVDLKGVRYRSTAESRGAAVHLTRELEQGLTFVDVKNYAVIQRFYQTVRTGDEDPVVLSDAPR